MGRSRLWARMPLLKVGAPGSRAVLWPLTWEFKKQRWKRQA
jgi:hypothetical protein